MAGRRIVAVACSGGRDSLALLHATAQAAVDHPVEVLALHVHHGLVAEADAWWTHLDAVCQCWAAAGLPVRFVGHRLSGAPAPGESVEAWARDARYAALHDMATTEGADLVLLAHHRRDQAETFLLQALRGGGTAGLAAMPRTFTRPGSDLVWMRPWLDRPRDAIEAYVAAHGLAPVEDPSNTDTRFARNRLRAEVWPALLQAFPEAETALATAATRMAQADAGLQELARHDLSHCVNDRGLAIASWSALAEGRRRPALKSWLHDQLPTPPAAALLDRLMVELDRPGVATWQVPGGALRRFRGALSFSASPPAPALAAAATRETRLAITRPGAHPLPGWGGSLLVTAVEEGGVPLAWLAHLELRERTGGEAFQAGLGRPARSLKKQFQAADVSPWHRDGPLVYSGGQLVFVPGLGLDARVVGLPGQEQVLLRWQAGDVPKP